MNKHYKLVEIVGGKKKKLPHSLQKGKHWKRNENLT